VIKVPNQLWFEASSGRGRLSRLFDRLALTGMVTLLGLVIAGCGAVASKAPSLGPSQSINTSASPASTMADLRNRPLKPPAMGAGGACPITPVHDLNPVTSGAKGKGPNFGFGTGPAYLSGTNQLYPGAFDNELWLVEPSYRGPILVRGVQPNGSQAVSFQEPTTFPDGGFSSAGSPPPGKQVATVTIQGSPFPFYQELDLPAASATNVQGYWRMFFARTHIEAPGCYAFQLDSLDVSVVIVFQVPDAARPGG
jgi:hypothetical protein